VFLFFVELKEKENKGGERKGNREQRDFFFFDFFRDATED
jgi:hypothetical protein